MDRTLLGIFAAEQTEHTGRLRALLNLSALTSPETSEATCQELLRRAHTLKGAARAVGLEQTERLVHGMESVFVGWRNGSARPDGESLALVHRVLDATEDILAWALGSRTEPDISVTAGALEALAGTPASIAEATSADTQVILSAAAADNAPELVRVSTTLLDDVIRSASHLLHASNGAARASDLAGAHLAATAQTLGEYSRLRRKCARYMRANAKAAAFAPVKETLEYLDLQLRHLAVDAQTSASAQQQTAREVSVRAAEVHENACRARLTPAQTVFGAFGAMVRDLAGQEGKPIEFRSDGLEVQADRVVLQALKDPVMHVLRNAVSHGIEAPGERAAAGKSPSGAVRLHITSRGDRLRVAVEDDGRGLDLRALANQAVRRGILSEAAAQAASPATVANLIFHPDITTSKHVTNLSGRGIGLSVVAQTVNALHGEVSVRHRAGGGVTIGLSLPLTISTQHVLLLEQNGRPFAVPAASVDRLCRFRSPEVRVVDDAETLVLDDQPVPLVKLAELLGISSPESDRLLDSPPVYQAVVLSSGEQRVAAMVDRLVDEREALVKDSGLPPGRAGLSAGAIPLEDGSVAVMLNVSRLLQQLPRARLSGHFNFPPASVEKKTRILVVDDSITTRSLEKSILESHGFEVMLAVDGLEALNMLRADAPDLVISDVSMPRMDGFQLLEQMKADKIIAHIPVILVTSLERREEQEKGLALGADAYIVKRKFDQRELLQIVRQIV